MQFFEELRWRGLLQDSMPGTEEYLNVHKAVGYVGFDPTAPSLGIGNMVPVMLLAHFQRHGHTPVALVGGATGRIGDPSGKSEERNLLSEEAIEYNLRKMEEQLRKLLAFEGVPNPARMANNYDWFKGFGFLDFLREVGKHLTVNYMMAKDSVKNRMASGTGISFTEFSYQLIQGYDFLHLYKHHGCKLQFGGSDQWGNITAGTELIRRMLGHEEEAFAFTAPLLLKSDGTKFGKSEKGNIYIDPEMTSPYKFYQFWVNATDDDVVKLVKTFSMRPVEELAALIDQENRPVKALQYFIGEEMTVRIHGQEAYARAKTASELLHGKGHADMLRTLTRAEAEDVFEGVDRGTLSRATLEAGINIVDFLTTSGAFESKGQARRALTQDKSVRINLEKVTDETHTITADDIVNGFFLLVDKSKSRKHVVYIG